MKWSALLVMGAVSVMKPTGAEHENILPSWEASEARHGIVEFVERATREASPDFVPETHRHVLIEAEGTLWSRGTYQHYKFTEVQADGAAPSLNGRWNAKLNERENARSWYLTGMHPSTRAPLKEMVYQPMTELVELLQEKGFIVWVATGPDKELTRAIVSEKLSIAPQYVIHGPRWVANAEADAPVRLASSDSTSAALGASDLQGSWLELFLDRVGHPPVLTIAAQGGALFTENRAAGDGALVSIRAAKGGILERSSQRDGHVFISVSSEIDWEKMYTWQ
ncbi:hypothetical protein E1162_17825 [Rhodobacteraceae bacterium RKSG542]|uniref:hypothetical protein n=1 Tax=Pseudovibrio flavus TaxID=2529854 RepID=UPI0012BC2B68|nr:hypothetical protein [Pseudovibrio flavus]MTI19105.1 hypothetical protein [Pseudovibrio flavus]